MSNNRTELVAFRLTKDERANLRAASKRLGKSESDLIREAIKRITKKGPAVLGHVRGQANA